MKRFYQVLIFAALFLSAAALFLFPEISFRAVGTGLTVCAGSILPALFPFFVLSELWISLGYNNRISQWLAPLMVRFFHLPGDTTSALLLGAVGGYPVGAQTVCSLYSQQRLNRADAESAMFFCNNAGPAFIFGILGGVLFQNAGIAAILWATHLFSAIILGFLFRPANPAQCDQKHQTYEPEPFLSALTKAISNGGQTTVRVCIYILFFSILTEYFRCLLPQDTASAILLGMLELAGGCTGLGHAGISQETAFLISAGLLGWGGLCVHCQTITVLYEHGLSAKRYLCGKLLHGLISTAIACLIAPKLPLQLPCFSGTNHPPVEEITLLCCLLLLLILKTSSGKMTKHRL